MSIKQFDDDCPDCRPIIIKDGHALPFDSPEMKIVMSVWERISLDERRAFHQFTCLGSFAPEVLRIVSRISEQIAAAFKADLA